MHRVSMMVHVTTHKARTFVDVQKDTLEITVKRVN